MITVEQFPDLSKNAKVQWQQARKEFGSVRDMLCNVKSVSTRTSEHSSMSEASTARRRRDGQDAYKGTVKQGYTKNFTQAEIALQEDVTKHMRMFDQYGEIMRIMRRMGNGTERRMEIDVQSLLSYAWSTSYTNIDGETVTTATPDGLALISPSHTVNGASGTFGNQIDVTHDPISASVLERLEEAMNGFLDDDGRLYPVMADTIISANHAPTVHEIQRIIGSQGSPDNANNNTNTFKGAYKHLILPYLNFNATTEAKDTTKNKYVFLAQLGNKDVNGFTLEMSQDVKFETPDQVFANSVWEYMTTAMYDFGTLRPTFIVGTKGNGNAV